MRSLRNPASRPMSILLVCCHCRSGLPSVDLRSADPVLVAVADHISIGGQRLVCRERLVARNTIRTTQFEAIDIGILFKECFVVDIPSGAQRIEWSKPLVGAKLRSAIHTIRNISKIAIVVHVVGRTYYADPAGGRFASAGSAALLVLKRPAQEVNRLIGKPFCGNRIIGEFGFIDLSANTYGSNHEHLQTGCNSWQPHDP